MNNMSNDHVDDSRIVECLCYQESTSIVDYALLESNTLMCV